MTAEGNGPAEVVPRRGIEQAVKRRLRTRIAHESIDRRLKPQLARGGQALQRRASPMNRQDIEPPISQMNAEIEQLISIEVIPTFFSAFNLCHLRYLRLNSGVLKSSQTCWPAGGGRLPFVPKFLG